MADEALARAARDLGGAAVDARHWVAEVQANAPRVASEALSLVDGARRIESAAGKLERAAARRMCIGVFGPSQSGKSYLVSSLCKPPPGSPGGKETVIAEFDGQELDFLKEINPPGDKEFDGPRHPALDPAPGNPARLSGLPAAPVGDRTRPGLRQQLPLRFRRQPAGVRSAGARPQRGPRPAERAATDFRRRGHRPPSRRRRRSSSLGNISPATSPPGRAGSPANIGALPSRTRGAFPCPTAPASSACSGAASRNSPSSISG